MWKTMGDSMNFKITKIQNSNDAFKLTDVILKYK